MMGWVSRFVLTLKQLWKRCGPVVRNDVQNNTVPFSDALDVISRTMRNVGSATPKASTRFVFYLKDYECRKCRSTDRCQMLVEFSKRSIPVPVWLEPYASEGVIVVR